MTKPNNESRFQSEEEIKETYTELINKLECTCVAGAKIKASPLPSATINLGDIIADQTRILTTFTSTYSIMAVVLRMISCIIDVICALVNPFSLIFAIIRLFGSCLPDFISIFPQFAIVAKIICIIKIFLAIVTYILSVITLIVEEIIDNIERLKDAFESSNKDAEIAISMKIASLFRELFNIIGIISALKPIFDMIKVLLNMGVSIPCGGGGGSCSNCGDDDSCPSAIQQTHHTGTDGQLTVIYGENIFDFRMYFYSNLKRSEFTSIRTFFPRGLDYTEIKDVDDFPYSITIDGNTYAVTSIDSGGTLSLFQIIPEFSTDGYLSLTTGSKKPLPNPTKDVRLGTPSATFSSSMINRYITISDTVSSNYINSGTWKITYVYDNHNVVLTREDEKNWVSSSKVYWKVAPTAPYSGFNKTFDFEINHAELVRHNLINLGCHPAIKAEKDGLNSRFPNINKSLPVLPDLDEIINNVTSCITNVVPFDVDAQYVLNNYNTIAGKMSSMTANIESTLGDFSNKLVGYGKEVYPRIFSPELTANSFTAHPITQVVGYNIDISLIAYDIYGEILGKGFPEDVVNAEIFTSDGIVSNFTEVLDAYGATTGKYTATLTSHIPMRITITAKVADTYVSYFNGSNLVPKEIEVYFIIPSEMVSELSEPLGAVGSE